MVKFSGIVTDAPPTGAPFTVRGRIRKYGAICSAAAPKPTPAGVSLMTMQFSNIPRALTSQVILAAPVRAICRAKGG